MEEMKQISEKIKNSLTIEQVYNLLYAFGGDPILKGNLIISRTICHGGDSHKLYYYDNTKLFRCYTECSDIFDIFDLIKKIKSISNEDWTVFQSIKFILKYFDLDIKLNNNEYNFGEEEVPTFTTSKDWEIINKYEENIKIKTKEEQKVELKIYDKKILKNLPKPIIKPWEEEGISRDVIKYNHICYDPIFQGIVIPHFDINNNLVGIRERTLIKENEENGKYKPAILNNQIYNHPLGFTLFNINNSKKSINNIKKVIVFEGEKSCLLYQSYFGIDNDISVAVCGSNLTKYQVNLLLTLGVKEICIAFDKQFKEIGDKEWKGWTKKLKDINKKYHSLVQISFLFDKWNFLEYKMSPIDNGPETFLELFKRRITL